MKKIAIVISDLVLGGGQRSALNLAAALSKDHDVSVIVFQDSYRQYDVPCRIINIECPDKENVFSKALNIIKRTWRLKKVFKAEQFDFIFSFMESANFVTSLACKKAILSVHCNPHELNSYESMLMRITYPRAKHIVAVSEDVATLLREDFNMQNVSRIYNLVSFTDIQKQGETPYQHKRPFIVALGRLNEVKRLDLLVAAYAESALKDHCDLLLIGEGEKRPELEAQIASLSLEDKVILTGVRANPFEYLASAEFLVLSSRTEAFPMVLIEALALSCPVVATDCPTGPREIVIDGENGLLVENGNQSELTAAMDRLFEDKALLAECRANALSSVDHLSADHVTKEWLALGDG
ncbi:glycosyltransferase [Leucothrix sargassi]|nr:glycosyltransferase [Leucothrix sargassi]